MERSAGQIEMQWRDQLVSPSPPGTQSARGVPVSNRRSIQCAVIPPHRGQRRLHEADEWVGWDGDGDVDGEGWCWDLCEGQGEE
mgnify:CR=1 FL=1